MTIDSGWVKILKANCQPAFTDDLTSLQKPDTVFIDGQIKLMKSDAIKTWDLFYKVQFKAPIERAFQLGASVVVLGFDNYQHVPEAKAPTQRKRCNKIQSWEFKDGDELPAILPESWPQAIRNRVFKSKVIKMVCNNLIRENYKDVTLVIDWIDLPIIVGKHIDLPQVCLNPTAKRGECDIKAFNYVDLGRLCIFSTDGDYIPLALLHCSQDVEQGAREIFLWRYKTSIQHSTGKRKIGISQPVTSKSGSRYEFVNIRRLLAFVRGQFYQFKTPILTFCTLVAMTGCDFTLNLPKIGPARLWACKEWFRSLESPDGADYEKELSRIILRLYADLLKSKVCVSVSAWSSQSKRPLNAQAAESEVSNQPDSVASISQDLQPIYKFIETHMKKISPNLEWSLERCIAHSKNTKWTVMYWNLLHNYPSPTAFATSGHTKFGFVLDSAGRTNFEAIKQY